MNNWHQVATINEIPNGGSKIIDLEGLVIVIFNLDHEYYAIEDRCPHQNLPLADGLIEDKIITCPYHGAKFCLQTGNVIKPPACEKLIIYPIKIVEEFIFLQIT